MRRGHAVSSCNIDVADRSIVLHSDGPSTLADSSSPLSSSPLGCQCVWVQGHQWRRGQSRVHRCLWLGFYRHNHPWHGWQTVLDGGGACVGLLGELG
jgi:hypothetical protein